VLVAFCSGEGYVGGFAEGFWAWGLADEGLFGFGRAPGFVGYSSEGEAGGFDCAAGELEACGYGDEGEGVALAVADF
jgi:hypothetical protein